MSQYPRWKYCTNKAIIVATLEEEETLVGKWYDTPWESASVSIPSNSVVAADADEPITKDALLARAVEIGLILDKRMSAVKIQSAIDAKLLEPANVGAQA